MGLRPFSHGFSTDIVQIAVFGRYMWQTTMDKSVKISMCLWKGKKGEHDQRKDCKGFSVCGPFPWLFDVQVQVAVCGRYVWRNCMVRVSSNVAGLWLVSVGEEDEGLRPFLSRESMEITRIAL